MPVRTPLLHLCSQTCVCSIVTTELVRALKRVLWWDMGAAIGRVIFDWESDTQKVKEVDEGKRNSWKWEWLQREASGSPCADFVRKINLKLHMHCPKRLEKSTVSTRTSLSIKWRPDPSCRTKWHRTGVEKMQLCKCWWRTRLDESDKVRLFFVVRFMRPLTPITLNLKKKRKICLKVKIYLCLPSANLLTDLLTDNVTQDY